MRLDAWLGSVLAAADAEANDDFLVAEGDDAPRRLAMAACSTIASFDHLHSGRAEPFTHRALEAAREFNLALKRPDDSAEPPTPSPAEIEDAASLLDALASRRVTRPSVVLSMVRSALAGLGSVTSWEIGSGIRG